MKKKKLLFAFLLLLIIAIPFSIAFGSFDARGFLSSFKFSASATTVDGYSYDNHGESANSIFGKTIPAFHVSSRSGHGSMTNVYYHEAQKGGKHYQGYCLHIDNEAHKKNAGNLRAYTFDDHFDGNVIKDKYGNSISDSQVRLLEALLASGYQYSSDNSKAIDNMSTTEARKMFVKQILVWEIVESGRTSFDSYQPEYHDSNSAYKSVITKNSKLEGYYKDYVDEAKKFLKEKESEGSSKVFGKSYTMSWNTNTKTYTTGAISGLNGYGNCKSDNDKVSVSVSGDKITLSSSEPNQKAKVTCTYTSGNGSNKWVYYKFTEHSNWQDLINGSAGATFKKSLNVKSEGINVKVIKKNSAGSNLSDSKFTLTKKDETSIKITLEGNKDPQVLNKTGNYILKEVKTPFGYEGIPETEITFDISNSTVTACTNKGTDKNGNITCQKGLITIKSNSSKSLYEIYVIDTEKEFKINKIDGITGKTVSGATFKMYTGSNFSTQVKFDKDKNNYTYNKNGSISELVDPSYSTYSLKLLEKGIYKIVETAVPSPYILATSEADRTRYIKVEDNYEIFECTDSSCSNKSIAPNLSILVKNYTTKVVVNKIGTGGKSLPGVKFVLLKEDKSTYVTSNLVTGLYNYSGTNTNIENATVYVTDASGNITVNNLPVGKYYFKEIETVEPYVIPEDPFTEVTIEMKADGPKVNSKSSNTIQISNASKEFNFYKIDSDGNYLSGGKFKIQKYNDEKGKYEDIKVSTVKNDGTYQKEADVFKADENGKVQFTLSHGIATFIEMKASSTYRIVELEAPKGYQITDIENSAIIKIDKKGYAKGSATIINQTNKLEGSTAQAELIIEIQTGQTVMKYGYIIAGTLIVIASLMGALIYITKKRK